MTLLYAWKAAAGVIAPASTDCLMPEMPRRSDSKAVRSALDVADSRLSLDISVASAPGSTWLMLALVASSADFAARRPLSSQR